MALTKKRTVVLFGLSADPPTGQGGHQSIVSWAATKLSFTQHACVNQTLINFQRDIPINAIWILPVYQHPYPEKHLADFEHRLAMSKLAFEHLSGPRTKVEVKDIEKTIALSTQNIKKPNSLQNIGTIDTVHYLMAEYPETQFVLLLGADAYQDLCAHKWKKSSELLATIPIICIARSNASVSNESIIRLNELAPISSSQIRRSNDREFLSKALHPDVFHYINTHQLYSVKN